MGFLVSLLQLHNRDIVAGNTEHAMTTNIMLIDFKLCSDMAIIACSASRVPKLR